MKRYTGKNMTFRFLAGTLILLLCANTWARDKTDIILMVNGDRITGEIKQLEHGKLRVSTDSLGDIRIEWDDIERIDSAYEFQFERTDGVRITGVIQDSPEQKEITLANHEETASFTHANVVRISQIENSFWERLKGSLAFGYSFTKASNVAQGNLGFRATHRTEERSFTLDGSTIITNDQEGKGGTQRSDISIKMTRFRENRWFNNYWLGFESNDELRLNLRTSIGTGLGRFLIQTNTSELGLMAGLVGTNEDVDSVIETLPSTTKQNLEGLLAIDYSRYIFDDPSLDLSTTLVAYPSITESGRIRTQFDLNLRWEIINDLYLDLSYYNTYDSDPQSDNFSDLGPIIDPLLRPLEKHDYGVVTSLGWSF